MCDKAVEWLLCLSLLHNFIQLSLNPGSVQVQILLAVCRRFAMVRISANVQDGNKAKRFSSVNHTRKTIHHHLHHQKSVLTLLINILLLYYLFRNDIKLKKSVLELLLLVLLYLILFPIYIRLKKCAIKLLIIMIMH